MITRAALSKHNEIDDRSLATHELLALVDAYSHDARTPLTAIGEFAAMLREGVITGRDAQEEAAGVICESAFDSSSLIDVLQTLAQTLSGEITPRLVPCTVDAVLKAAAERIGQFDNDRGFLPPYDEAMENKLRCDPDLAALALSHLWCWMRRTRPREVRATLRLHVEPPDGVAIRLIKPGSAPPLPPLVRKSEGGDQRSEESELDRLRLPTSEVRPPISDIRPPTKGGKRGMAEPQRVRPQASASSFESVPRDLRLRLARELGRLAGGDVAGVSAGVALVLPLASESNRV